jgi:hypothetical protein
MATAPTNVWRDTTEDCPLMTGRKPVQRIHHAMVTWEHGMWGRRLAPPPTHLQQQQSLK